MYVCHNCGNPWTEDHRPGFRETCDQCSEDLHVCKNCRHYDAKSYDSCREPMAERVSDVARANRCNYFEWIEYSDDRDKIELEDKSKAKDAFNSLFGNLPD